ncbi:MAG: TlpA disulfide reductase family protein [Candidatus Omnitrophota bacterium]
MLNLPKRGMFLLSAVLFLVFSTVKAACAEPVLNDLQSNPVDISENTGRPRILFFWTTWCPYCRSELKVLDGMYPQIKKEGIDVLAVNIGEPGYKVEKFLKGRSLGIRVLLDRYGRASDKYKIRGVPTYICVGSDGQVVSVGHVFPEDYKEILLK